jgi:hypothetical protein
MELILMNGHHVEVSQEEIKEFITQFLISNPYWRHSGLLSQEEVMRYLKRESSCDELKKVARYLLIYVENLSFTAYLFDKSEGNPDQGKEFNMPIIKKLRHTYRRLLKNQRTPSRLAGGVYEMENLCLKIGADPL